MDLPETAEISRDDRTIAMLSHLLSLFFGFLAPLVIWLVKKEESDFIGDQAKESLNFQLTMLAGFILCFILSFVLIGALLMPLLGIFDVVMVIIATIKSNEGQRYRYPFAIRIIS